MMKLEALFIRLLIACVFGLAVAGVAIYLVPGSVANVYDYPQQRTRRQIERVVRELDEHRGTKGTFPSPSSPQALDILVMGDGWHRPLHYSLPNGKPLVESLGRDGIRGGVGLDADISNQVPRPTEAVISFWEKLADPLAKPMVIVALLCGIGSGTTVLLSFKDESTAPKSWMGLCFVLSLAFLMAAFGAVFITALHIPSGH